jgi:hypothetical protein
MGSSNHCRKDLGDHPGPNRRNLELDIYSLHNREVYSTHIHGARLTSLMNPKHLLLLSTQHLQPFLPGPLLTMQTIQYFLR